MTDFGMRNVYQHRKHFRLFRRDLTESHAGDEATHRLREPLGNLPVLARMDLATSERGEIVLHRNGIERIFSEEDVPPDVTFPGLQQYAPCGTGLALEGLEEKTLRRRRD